VPLTNAKGAFSASLGEWAIFGCMWFAKKVNAMRKAQAAGKWMRDSVGMLQGKTMSIVGYGDIGRAWWGRIPMPTNTNAHEYHT